MRAVIVNPASGGGLSAATWRRIVSEIEGGVGGRTLRVALTTRRGGAIELTRGLVEEGCRDFVVLGGDGTIGEVVAGCMHPDGTHLLADDITLALVHTGTGGDIVRGLGIPRRVHAAVEVARTGVPRRLDIGVATFVPSEARTRHGAMVPAASPTPASIHRAFLSNANVGMSAEVVERAEGGGLKRFGRTTAFALATVTSLLHNRPRPLRIVTAEGRDLSEGVVDFVVCNNRYMGGGMKVAPDADLCDGLFDLVVLGAVGRLRLLRAFPGIYSGRHVKLPFVRIERSAGVEVASAGGDGTEQRVVLDGELVGHTPASMRLVPGAISVLVPRAAGGGV